ncbi:MAG: DUF1036 domain-containing protein [Rhodobacteraceae bacterium]|nr:DUF1036 domain-containing protein [Paracoccaceae bacterium]
MTGRIWLSVAMALAPLPAWAGLEICNQTSVRQSVAIGYMGDGGWTSEGWWNIPPGECATTVSGDLRQRYYYYHAEAEGRRFLDEDYQFCTRTDAFTIVGDENCAARGFDSALFRQIDTGPEALEFTLTMLDDANAQDDAAPAPDPRPAPPGAFGPTESFDAVYQECLTRQGAAYCAFHADGAKFYVYEDDRTPPALLDQLETLTPGAAITVTGDMVEVFDTSVEFVLHSLAARAPTPGERMLAALQGGWYAVDDPAAQITFLGAERADSHDGADMGTAFVQVGPQCNGFSGGGPYLAARTAETGETDCYAIDRLGDRDMTLIYLPRGNILDYRRLD